MDKVTLRHAKLGVEKQVPNDKKLLARLRKLGWTQAKTSADSGKDDK